MAFNSSLIRKICTVILLVLTITGLACSSTGISLREGSITPGCEQQSDDNSHLQFCGELNLNNSAIRIEKYQYETELDALGAYLIYRNQTSGSVKDYIDNRFAWGHLTNQDKSCVVWAEKNLLQLFSNEARSESDWQSVITAVTDKTGYSYSRPQVFSVTLISEVGLDALLPFESEWQRQFPAAKLFKTPFPRANSQTSIVFIMNKGDVKAANQFYNLTTLPGSLLTGYVDERTSFPVILGEFNSQKFAAMQLGDANLLVIGFDSESEAKKITQDINAAWNPQ